MADVLFVAFFVGLVVAAVVWCMRLPQSPVIKPAPAAAATEATRRQTAEQRA